MKLLARINKKLRLVDLKYVVFSPNDFVYNNLQEVSLFVQFNHEVYRLDGIKRGKMIDRDTVYSAIEDDNKTWIAKYLGSIEAEVQRMKDNKGSMGNALSEIITIR